MSIYENNLVALTSVDGDLVRKLKEIETNERYEVFLAEGEPLEKIKIVDLQKNIFIDNSEDDLSNKLKKYEEYDNYHSLYFFGIGTGVFFQKLLQNPNHKAIYVFEPELELIYITLNLIDLSVEILQKRLFIKHSFDMTLYEIKQLITKESTLYLKTYNLDIYSIYYDQYIEEVKRINELLILNFRHVLQDKGDSLEDTLIGLRHSSQNMIKIFKHPSLSQLVSKVKNRKDAVMVATGPSLYKQLPFLKKYQEYFTILCIDASFPILAKEGIQPDIVLSMERGSATAKFYKDTPKEFYKNVIFLIATVCHDEVFEAIDSKKGVIVPFLRADRHNMALKLDEWGYLGGGLSSANYLFTFAINSDFQNFVFIGQDLAYGKDGSSHAKGHVYGEDEVKDDKFAGYITAYGGQGQVATMKYWKVFLNDLVVQIATSKKYKNMHIYNATEGGARIDGTIEIAFKEYCDRILDTDVKKEQIILTNPTKIETEKFTKFYVQKQVEYLQLGKSIQKQAKKAFNNVEEFLNQIKDYNDEELIKKVNDKTIEKLLDQIYQVREKYANPVFLNFYSSLLESYVAHVDFDLAVVKTMRENSEEAIKRKKIAYIKINYEWLYRVSGSLYKIIEIIKNNLI